MKKPNGAKLKDILICTPQHVPTMFPIFACCAEKRPRSRLCKWYKRRGIGEYMCTQSIVVGSNVICLHPKARKEVMVDVADTLRELLERMISEEDGE